MDAWDKAKVDSLSAEMKAKYDRRYQKGDIIEVREDGYWDKRGFDKEAFCVVKVPGEAVDLDKMEALYDIQPKDAKTGEVSTVLNRRKWKADDTKMATADKDALDGATKAGHLLVVKDSAGNTIFESEADGANFIDVQPIFKVCKGVVATTMDSGKLYVFYK